MSLNAITTPRRTAVALRKEVGSASHGNRDGKAAEGLSRAGDRGKANSLFISVLSLLLQGPRTSRKPRNSLQ